ncbi:alpha/beta fold hydrolase [Sorangium sp. So ce887]|uniref:alpha/beta fold hydrolase n=1 Tax=Sorangium sp. So ce887 TaxID=3133324 RepID=UPI003F6447D1
MELQIPMDPVPLFARITGPEEGEILVLLAGPGDTHEYMLPLDRLASERLRVVAYDQRGVGRSPAPEGTALAYAEHVADLERLRAHFGVGRMHLLGHSWGGALATLYAAAHPDRVASLLLVGSLVVAPGLWEAGRQNLMNRVMQLTRQGLVTRPAGFDCNDRVKAAAPAYFADPRFPVPEVIMAGNMNCQVDWHITESLKGVDVRPRLAPLRVPAMVIQGDSDFLGLDIAQASMEALRAAKPELVVVPRCGHFPWFECPTPFFAAAQRFLREVVAAPAPAQ